MKKKLSLVLAVAMFQLVLSRPSFAEPIHDAVRDRNLTRVKELISAGADVNARGELGWTPLHFAAYCCRTEIVQALITARANANAPDDNGSRPLHVAIRQGCTATLLVLLDAGANVDTGNNYGDTPLHVAAFEGRTQAAQVFLTHGANVNTTNKDGFTPLQMAQKYDRAATVAALQPEAIALLHTTEAFRQTELGNHTLAARSHTWAAKAKESLERAATSFLAAQDFSSASQSYNALFISHTLDVNPDELDRAEARAVSTLETAAMTTDDALEAAIAKDDADAKAALRLQAIQIDKTKDQVRTHAAASRDAILSAHSAHTALLPL